MVSTSGSVSTAAGNNCYIRGNLTCVFSYVIYLVECINYKSQYVGPATSFKQRFSIHKSDIKTNKYCCVTAMHLIHLKNSLYYLQM